MPAIRSKSAYALQRAGLEPTSSVSWTSPASHEGRGTLLDVVRRTAEQCVSARLDGRRRDSRSRRYPHAAPLRAGAERKVSINSAAIKEPELLTRGAHLSSARNASSWPSTPSAADPGRWNVFIPRRPHRHRTRRGGMGARGRRARRRRNSVDQHGRRRRLYRLRPGVDPETRRQRTRSGHRVWRRGHP